MIEKSVSSSRSRTGSALSDRRFVPSSKSGLYVMDLMQKYPAKDGSFYYQLEKYLNEREVVFKTAIKQARQSLSSEKKKLLNVSVQQSSVFFEKTDLELIFLECVDEVRKEVIKRRTNVFSNQKYTKRAASSQSVEKTTLTPSDKQKILELLVSNEKVLVLIYEKLFPHKANPYSHLIKSEEVLNEPMPSLEEMLKQVPARIDAKTAAPQFRGRFLAKF